MLGGGTGANTLSNTVALIGDTTIGVDAGQLTIGGIISGAAGLTKAGLGMLSLGGANTYNGVTTISTGILEANVASALGAITAGTVVASGATLHVAAVTVVGEQLTINGSGVGGSGTGGTGFGSLPTAATCCRHAGRCSSRVRAPGTGISSSMQPTPPSTPTAAARSSTASSAAAT